MATTIITKHSAVAKDPLPGQLERGELAIDLERKNIYTKDASDEVVQLGGRPVKIGATAPPTPQEGDLWMEVPTAVDQPAMMWVYDGDKWLEHPSGVDGAPGADGNIQDATEQGVIATWDNTAGQWTPEDDVRVEGGRMAFGFSGYPQSIVHVSSGNYPSVRLSNDDGSTSLNLSHTKSTGTSDISATGALMLKTAGTERMRIDASGNLLVSNGGRFYLMASGGISPFMKEESNGLAFWADGSERMRIDANGDTTFSGAVHAHSVNDCRSLLNGGVGGIILADAPGQPAVLFPSNSSGNPSNGENDVGGSGAQWRNGWFSGTVNSSFVRMSSGLAIGTRDIIETLHTLREATKDESTLEGLRDAIGNAVGGLIEKFEAMQNQAVTQDIQEGPVTQEITNED